MDGVRSKVLGRLKSACSPLHYFENLVKLKSLVQDILQTYNKIYDKFMINFGNFLKILKNF